MSRPRSHQSISGIRASSTSAKPPNPIAHQAEDIADPVRPRQILDYILARRAVLEQIKYDALMREQVCDADPYLIRAAKNHGETTERTCPICAKSELVHVNYTFGDDLGYLSGRVKSSTDLKLMAYEYGHFRVYVVEACTLCGWNHLHMSYVLGDGTPRVPPREPRDVLK